MYILGFETTGPIGSVAIIDLNKCDEAGKPVNSDAIRMKITDEPMSHLKYTAKLAEELIEEMEGGPSAVAASIGPGSFTGIRIGVTLARAIAQSLEIPAIKVPTLEVFRERIEGGEGPITAAILNARRGQVYGAVYGAHGETLMMPGPYMLTDVLDVTDKYMETVFFGDGVDSYSDILELEKETHRSFAPEDIRYQTADLVVKIAARKYVNGDTVSPEELLPDYMRLAEAEQKLKDGTLAKLREEKMRRFITR